MKRTSAMVGLLVVMAGGNVLLAQGEGAAVSGGNGGSRGMGKDEYAQAAKARLLWLKKRFEARERNKDPFGLPLDPGVVKEEPVMVAEVMEEEKVVAPVKVVSLQDAVDKFQVNGVNAAKQMVMVGARFLRRGDPVEIEHDGELFKLRIVKISVDEVVFMNTKNDETAGVRLGVVKGIRGMEKAGGDTIEDKVVKPESTFKVKE